MEDMYTSILDSHKATAPPRIVAERMYDPLNFHTWTPDDPMFELRARYSCLFPKRVLFLSHQFIYWEDINELWIPIDFISLATTLDSALRAGLTTLLPSRINYKDENYISFEKLGTFHYRESKNIVQIPGSGYGYHELQTAIAQEDRTNMDVQLMAIPWLLGARVEDYVETVQNNPEKFELYTDSLGNLLNSQSESTDTLVEWVKEVSYGVKKLEVIFKKKNMNSRSKGLKLQLD